MGGPRMDDRTWANGGKKACYVCVVSLKQDRVDGHKLGKKQYTGRIVSCQLPASYEVLLARFIPILSTHIESGSFLPFILFSQSWLWLATLLPSYWGKARGRKQHNVKSLHPEFPYWCLNVLYLKETFDHRSFSESAVICSDELSVTHPTCVTWCGCPVNALLKSASQMLLRVWT